MTIRILCYKSTDDISDFESEIEAWSILWWSDLEEAGVTSMFVAFDGDKPVGFQTVNIDGLCVAIEVKDDYQGKGIARELVEESGCIKPERNGHKSFWDRFQPMGGF